MLTDEDRPAKRKKRSKIRRCQFDFKVEKTPAKTWVDDEKLVCLCWPVPHWRIVLIRDRAPYLAALHARGLLTKGGRAWKEAVTGERAN